MKSIKSFILLFSFFVLILFFYAFDTKNILSKFNSLSYLLRIIDNYYVEDVALDEIMDGAIHGLLEELDPHSAYFPAEDFKMMQESLVGEFEGIGIEFAILDGYITVISPIPDTPSAALPHRGVSSSPNRQPPSPVASSGGHRRS